MFDCNRHAARFQGSVWIAVGSEREAKKFDVRDGVHLLYLVDAVQGIISHSRLPTRESRSEDILEKTKMYISGPFAQLILHSRPVGACRKTGVHAGIWRVECEQSQ